MALNYYEWLIANTKDPALKAAYQSQQATSPSTNPLYEGRWAGIMAKLGQLSGNWNTKRQTNATNASLFAKESGLSDETSVAESARTAGDATLGTGDSVSYKIVMGPDGKAYRQAYMSQQANVGARNWGGSEDTSRQWQARQDLNAQRDKLTTGLGTDQAGTVINQGTELTGLTDQAQGIAGDYGGWKVDTAAAAKAVADAAAGGGGGGDDAPAALKTTIYKYAKTPSKKTLTDRFGATGYTLAKRGGGKKTGYTVKVTR